MQVGAFGLGTALPPNTTDSNANNAVLNGIYYSNGAAAINYYSGYTPLLSLSRLSGNQTQIQANTSGILAVRCSSNNVWSAWITHYNTANTTRASDGTLKASSPVIRLFADGRYETNEEAEGCVVRRLDVGSYLIEGCNALNSDAAWGGVDGGFDIPTDRNRQPLIWLDYEVNADGSVLVKTYHRRNAGSPPFAHNEIDGLAEGDPVDIPCDQYVSVRVEMPANSIWEMKSTMTKV